MTLLAILAAGLVGGSGFGPPAPAPVTAPCGSGAVSVSEAHLAATIDPVGKKTILVLSGKAQLKDPSVAAPVQAICAAATGHALRYDNKDVCAAFSANGALSGSDRVSTAGADTSFVFTAQSQSSTLGFGFAEAPRANLCPGAIDVTVRPAAGYRFARLNQMPRALTGQAATVVFTSGALQGASFGGVLDQSVAGPGPRLAREPAPEGPGLKTWRALLGPYSAMGAAVLHDVLAALAPLLLFYLWQRGGRPWPAASDPWRLGGRPILTAAALFMCSTLLQTGQKLSNSFVRPLLGAARSQDMRLPALTLLVLAAGAAALWALGRAALRRGHRRHAHPLEDIPELLVMGLAFAAALAGFAALTSFAGAAINYEPPALAVSAALALLATLSVRRTWSIGVRMAVILAVVLMSTVLLPTAPVVSGDLATVAQNTFYWADLMARPAAGLLFSAALVALGYRLIRASDISAANLRRGLAVLLVLDMVGFGSRTVFGVAGGAAVILAGPYLLFSHRKVDAEPEQPEDVPTAFALLTGSVAAGIYLVQAYFTPKPALDPALQGLQLVGVFETFATGLLAGLLFSRAKPVLRGNSAALKAITVSFFLLAGSVVTSLDSLTSTAILTPMAENLGIVAALIVCAIAFYDLDKIRADDGSLDWRHLFKGSILTNLVPIVSAIVVALYSVLSPILEGEMKGAFTSALKSKLESSTPKTTDPSNPDAAPTPAVD